MHGAASPSSFWCGEKRFKVSTMSPNPTTEKPPVTQALSHTRKLGTTHVTCLRNGREKECRSPQNLSLVNFFSSAVLAHLPPIMT